MTYRVRTWTWSTLTLVTIAVALTASLAVAQEVTLYDASGNAAAYIAMNDGLTIYLWSGTPVAYLHPRRSVPRYSVYGLNGTHLGWYDGSTMRDGEGHIVGFTRGAHVDVQPRLEPLKGLKQLKPLQRLRSLEPLERLPRTTFARLPLAEFLRQGR
jgi:hypothetical protein